MSSVDGTTPVKSWSEELRARYDAGRAATTTMHDSEMGEVLELRMRDLQQMDPKDPLFKYLYDRVGELQACIQGVEDRVRKKQEDAEKKAAKPKKKKKPRTRRKTAAPAKGKDASSVLEPAAETE